MSKSWKLLTPLMILGLVLVLGACDDTPTSTDDGQPTPFPVASAGGNIHGLILNSGDEVSLDGSGSFDTGDRPLTYQWTLVTRPMNSQTEISNPDSAVASLMPDSSGVYAVSLTVTAGGSSDTDAVTVEVGEVFYPIIWDRNIDSAHTLQNITSYAHLVDYVVPEDVFVLSITGPLTIEPGVRIRFEKDLSLEVRDGGAIMAEGTEASMIVFEGAKDTLGFWQGIFIDTNDPGEGSQNVLDYVEIKNAGVKHEEGDGLRQEFGLGNVTVSPNGELRISNSLLHTSDSYGLIAEPGAQLPGFSSNHFRDNSIAPLRLPMSMLGWLDNESTYALSNEAEYGGFIDVHDSEDVTAAQTWPGAPVQFDTDTLYVQAPLDILPGARIRFFENSVFSIEPGGTITAIGTAERNIQFLGETDIVNNWQGITLNNPGSVSELRYVTISNAGAGGLASISCGAGTQLILANSLLQRCGVCINVAEGADIQISENLFTLAQFTMKIPIDMIDMIDESCQYDSDIQLLNIVDITQPQTWPSAPYRITSPLIIQSDLTIRPGARLSFNLNTYLEVQETGSLKAVGTEEAITIFRSAFGMPARWQGLRFDSSNSNNELAYVEVMHSGQSNRPNIMVTDTGYLNLTNSVCRSSNGYGLEVESGGMIDFASNSFEGNIVGAIKIPMYLMSVLDDDSFYDSFITVIDPTPVSEPTSWGAVPFKIDFDIAVSSDLVLRPGIVMSFVDSYGIDIAPTGSLSAVGTALIPVILGGLDQSPGDWRGLNFDSASALNELDYAQIRHGGFGGSANISLSATSVLKMTNSVCSRSETYGLRLEQGAQLSAYGNNFFENNELAPMLMPMGMIPELDENSSYEGSIEVTNIAPLTVDQTWPRSPFFFNANLELQSQLTLEAGANLSFATGTQLLVSTGYLSALGSEEEPVVFRGQDDAPGSWLGITVQSNHEQGPTTKNLLNFADVGFAGGNNIANIVVESPGRLRVFDSFIHYSSNCGISVEEGATLDVLRNEYQGNFQNNDVCLP